MNEKEFRAQIKSGLSGGYLIYGEEEYLKDRLVPLAVKSVVGDDDFSKVNLIENDENSYDPSFLEDALSASPMMAEKCCAVFRVRFSELGEGERENVYASLDILKHSPPVVLLFVIPSGYFDEGNLKRGKPSAEYRELTRYLTPVEVPYQAPAVLGKWAEKHFASDGLSVAPNALSYLIDTSGPDMYSLSGEIEKISCYAHAKGMTEVDRNTVAAICSENGELDAFALSNAVVSGNREGALAAIRECREKKMSPVSVIARMTSEFNNMMFVSAYMKNGMLKGEISKKLGIHEFRVGKYMEAVRDVETSAVRTVIERCVEVDTALKSSSGGFDLLERFVCTIPAKKRF